MDGKIVVNDKFKEVMQEIDIMRQLEHKNVIKMVKVMKDERSDELYIVMNYAEKGQLLHWDV